MSNKIKRNFNFLKDKFIEFNKDTYGMLIVISWVVLIICMIIKLLGGNWFELGTDNEKFIAFCNYVDENMWLKMILACCIYLFTTLPAMCVFLNKDKLSLKLHLLFVPLMVIKSITSWYLPTIAFILDIGILVVMPIIISKKWKRVIIANIIVMVFQLITLFFRNIPDNFTLYNTFLVQMIYQVDYFIMIILFYLYNFKKRGDK